MGYPTPPDTPSTANQYILKPTERTYASSARLNLQHYLWRDQLGYLVHPSIQLAGSDLRIADVGTGTGIWLLELAATLPPSTKLDGFDIDIADCPPKEWLPPNVNFSVLDAFGEIPAHLVGRYDVVQLRLFHVVVKNNDPGPLLRNVMKMLKPGGYIQWLEYDMGATKIIKTNPSLSSTALDAIPTFRQQIRNKDEKVGVQNWIPNLASIFCENNLTSVTASRHVPTPASLPYQLDVFLLTYEELSIKWLDALPGGHGEHLRGLIAKASEEGRKGVAWSMDKQVVVGRKPFEGDEDGMGAKCSQDERDGLASEQQKPKDSRLETVAGKSSSASKPVVEKRKSRRDFFRRFIGRNISK